MKMVLLLLVLVGCTPGQSKYKIDQMCLVDSVTFSAWFLAPETWYFSCEDGRTGKSTSTVRVGDTFTLGINKGWK